MLSASGGKARSAAAFPFRLNMTKFQTLHVDTVCEGAGADPWGEDALPVPARFSEHGEPPVVTLTGPVPPGAVQVSGGRVTVRFETDAGTIAAEMRDPPPPPVNKPLVTVSVGPDGKPLVEVEGGSARVRILDG